MLFCHCPCGSMIGTIKNFLDFLRIVLQKKKHTSHKIDIYSTFKTHSFDMTKKLPSSRYQKY